MRTQMVILLALAMFGLGIVVREISWPLSAVLGVLAVAIMIVTLAVLAGSIVR